MAETLYELVNRCTVRIVVPATEEQGTGFFVAPGQVVTCAHVVKAVGPETPVRLFWQAGPNQPVQELRAQVQASAEAEDLALLVLEIFLEHPCVWLGEDAAPFQKLYSFGYPARLAPDGTSTTVECEGWLEGAEERLLSLKAGQVSPGMSGAPLLNIETGQICGVIARTKDEWSALGGRAILTQTIWQVFPSLRQAQDAWRKRDQRWKACLEAHRRRRAPSTRSRAGTVRQRKRPSDYLPLQPTSLFQERPGEFAELERLLFGQHKPAHLALVGVVGMGGVGKTALAVEVAERFKPRFPDGIFWLRGADSEVDWQRDLAHMGERSGYLPPYDMPGQADTTYRRACHVARYIAEHEQALLILDNVDRPEVLLSVLLALAGLPLRCTVLYTSRLKEVPPGVTRYAVDRLPREAAMALLLEGVRPEVLREVRAGSQSKEAQAAHFLCQKVEGLPLGLLLLRSLLAQEETVSVAELAHAVRAQGVTTLTEDALRAVFAVSLEQVQDPDAQRLFLLAGCFPEAAPIPLWLLGLVSGLGKHAGMGTPLAKARRVLQRLSLLEGLAAEQVRLHPLLREYAQQVLSAQPEQGQALRQEAGEQLRGAVEDLGALEGRLRQEGFWSGLEQVRQMAEVGLALGVTRRARLDQVQRWLERESHLLGNRALWPEGVPGLVYQQVFNRGVEEDLPLRGGTPPERWVRLLEPVGAEDPALLRVMDANGGAVESVAFSPDGQRLLTGYNDYTARLWDAQSGQLLATLTGHQSVVTSVAFSPDGQRLLTGSEDHTARLWDAQSGQLLATLSGHQGGVTSVAFNPDGQRLLTGSRDQTARLWDAQSGQLLATLSGHQGAVWSVAFSPDGTRLLTGSADQTARLWDARTSKAFATLSGHQDQVWSAAFSPDGQRVLTGSGDDTARLWDANTGQALATLLGQQSHVRSVAFSPDGQRLLTGSWDVMARLWDVQSGQLLATLSGHQSGVESVAFSPDGQRLLTGGDGTVRLWDAQSGQLLATPTGHQGSVESVAFSPDGQRVLTGSWDETARLWDTRTSKALATLTGHQSVVWSVAFSPDGQRVLTGSADQTARLWDARTGQALATLTGHQDFVESVAFNPDGTHLLTGSRDGTARLWDARTGQALATLTGHQDFVKSVAFNPDGTHLLTGSRDGTARLWDAQSGQLLATLSGHQGSVESVAFGPDGTRLAVVALTNGQVWFWNGHGDWTAPRLVYLYAAVYPIKAACWRGPRQLLLADDSGPHHRPFIYRLALEGY